jgi:hypothetical protein
VTTHVNEVPRHLVASTPPPPPPLHISRNQRKNVNEGCRIISLPERVRDAGISQRSIRLTPSLLPSHRPLTIPRVCVYVCDSFFSMAVVISLSYSVALTTAPIVPPSFFIIIITVCHQYTRDVRVEGSRRRTSALVGLLVFFFCNPLTLPSPPPPPLSPDIIAFILFSPV